LESLENSLLSKSNLQEIKFSSHIKNIKIENFITHENSTLYSSILFLNDLICNTLKHNKNEIIEGNWYFNELTIKGP
jgi:hypothetical protein